MADMFSKKAGEMVVGAVGIVSALLLFVSYVMYLILLGIVVIEGHGLGCGLNK